MHLSHEEVMAEFRDAGALLDGHFVLSSGLHSRNYLQCALVLKDPWRAEKLCRALADKLRSEIPGSVDMVASPAMGGVVVGYEIGRQLGVPAIFLERVDGRFTLRRGFTIARGANVVMVEDIVTTGLSSRECIAAIRCEGGNVLAAACLIDRSNGQAEVGAPLVSLTRFEIPVYAADRLPPELAAVPASKPGSRNLR
jgi:orotate phosphoribosyltransferase